MDINPGAILAILEQTYGGSASQLRFDSVFQLLIAVMLSAQTNDNQVNRVTEQLFRAYPDAAAFGKLTLKSRNKGRRAGLAGTTFYIFPLNIGFKLSVFADIVFHKLLPVHRIRHWHIVRAKLFGFLPGNARGTVHHNRNHCSPPPILRNFR